MKVSKAKVVREKIIKLMAKKDDILEK